MATTPEPQAAVKQVAGDQMEQVLALCDVFRQVIEQKMHEFPDAGEAFGNGMIAAVTFAGMLAGHLIVLGAYSDTREQHAMFAQMLQTNFPTGIRLGKLHAMQQIAILEGKPN